MTSVKGAGKDVATLSAKSLLIPSALPVADPYRMYSVVDGDDDDDDGMVVWLLLLLLL